MSDSAVPRWCAGNAREPMPLDAICDRIVDRSSLREIDVRQVLTILGVPPSGEYLLDGLRRTGEIIRLAEPSFDLCYTVTPTLIDNAAQFRGRIDQITAALDGFSSGANSQCGLPMARDSEDARHPLRGYCLSRLHYWCLLFYRLSPKWDDGESGLSYQRLLANVAAHIMAANARINPDRYFAFCRHHWKSGEWPDVSPLRLIRETGGDNLASRVANAAIAVRQLAHPELGLAEDDHEEPTELAEQTSQSAGDSALALEDEFAELRLAISLGSDDEDFGNKIAKAERCDHWTELPARRIAQLSRMCEAVRPFHHRANSRSAQIRAGSKKAPSGTARRTLADGYVRLPDSDYVEQPTEDEDGGSIVGKLEQLPEDSDDPRNDDRWMPTDDRIAGDLLESVLSESRRPSGKRQERTAGSQAYDSRWAAEQARRHRLLMPYRLDSLSVVDGATLFRAISSGQIPDALKGIYTKESHSDIRESLSVVLGPLLASLSLGRSYNDATKVDIVDSASGAELPPDKICFLRDEERWSIPVSPPAWDDLPVTAIERPIGDRLLLPDVLGFENFLRFNPATLDGNSFATKSLSKRRRRFIADWIDSVAPGCAVSMAGIQRFLFERVIAVSKGDIGLAALITGRNHAHSGSVAHYAHYSANQIQTAYGEALKPVGGRCTPHVLGCTDPAVGYGAKRVPTREAVEHLLQQLRSCPSSDFHVRHNYYTLYTYAALHLGIALRSIVDPKFKSVSELLGALVSWTDKARTDYHRRVAVLCPSVVGHLRHYAEYLNLARATDLLPRNNANLNDAAFLFYTNGAFEPLRPKHFEIIARAYFPLEPYSLRRFMRTELAAHPLTHGCDLDAFFGHWFDRVSPHDPLSAYALNRMKTFANGPVADILDSVAFTPQAFQW